MGWSRDMRAHYACIGVAVKLCFSVLDADGGWRDTFCSIQESSVPYPRRYIPRKPPSNYRPQFAQYEFEKRAWLAHHPKATGEEYQQAMREIAQRCKI